ncbi:MAG TPA: NAD-binding protein [Capsulimonadaceae bacterium]|jgi:voltage-gated potassium channel
MRRGSWLQIVDKPRFVEKLSLPYFRLRIAISLFTGLMLTGMFGYHLIEHWTLLESLFMTVITLSSVGFGEVHPLSHEGEVFTIFLIVFGVGVVAWGLSTTIEVLTSEHGIHDMERRRLRRIVKAMNHHFIVCGYGRIGQSIVKGLKRNNVPLVVVECEAERLEMLRTDGIPFIEGDASSDQTLELAGIGRARALIAVTPTDAVNTFIVLSARGLNSTLMIVVRADAPENIAKLYRAGATKVVSPHSLGGWWMAATAVNPAATDFMEGLSLADHSKISLYEFNVADELTGKAFGSFHFKTNTGALVVAVRRGGEFHANPPNTLILFKGDALMALGSPEQLKRLAQVCNPKNPVKIDLAFELPDRVL